MTDHIVSFAIGIDDNAIVEQIQKNADKQIITEIKIDIMKQLFQNRYGYSNDNMFTTDRTGKRVLRQNDIYLSDFAEKLVKEALVEYKEDIVAKAAELLADSFKRTKAWKEATKEVIDAT